MTSSTGEERSAYDRVPVWDGTPSTYRRFETAVEWWLEAENLDVPYSLAGRLTHRLRGPARARAEEFKPHELRPIRSWYSKFPSAPRPVPDPRHQRPEGRLLRPDDDDVASMISVHSAPTPGDEPRRRTRSRGAQRDDAFPETVAVVPRDESYVNLRFGIDTLMDAMKVVAGVGARDMQRTKAELLDSFHGELFKRKAGQSILDWNTDFRKMLVRLKEAQVIISPEEAGWKLKHRMGLSQGRMELLDVATGSSLDPEIIQLHSERLFRSIHHAEKNLAPRGAFPSKLASLLKQRRTNRPAQLPVARHRHAHRRPVAGGRPFPPHPEMIDAPIKLSKLRTRSPRTPPLRTTTRRKPRTRTSTRRLRPPSNANWSPLQKSSMCSRLRAAARTRRRSPRRWRRQ